MKRILRVLTPEIANAAGLDAGNRSMRAAGREVWSIEDYNVACAETNRLLDIIEEADLKSMKLECGHTMADWIESGMGMCGTCDRGKYEKD